MNAPDYKDQIAAAFAEMKRRLLPAVLAHNDSNIIVIGNFILKRGLSGTSVDDLLFAVSELDQKELITWQTPPVAPAPAPKKSLDEQAAEFAEKERQRIVKEARENAQPFDIAGRTKVAEVLEARKKAQESAKNALQHLISAWSKNSAIPGRIDEAKSDAGRKALASVGIERGRGNKDYVLTLAAVQKLFHFDSVQEILANKDEAVQAVLRAANGVVDPKAAKDALIEQRRLERKGNVGVSNLPQYK